MFSRKNWQAIAPCWLVLVLTVLAGPVVSAQPAEAVADEPARRVVQTPFEIVPREDRLTYYPCMACHQVMEVNYQERDLAQTPHLKEQPHGQGRFWCLTCHDPDDRNSLRTLKGERVGFSETHLVCEQCHSHRGQDWFHGAHGKRVDNWQGQRAIYTCTECHDPHNPVIPPGPPDPPPPTRIGFPPPQDHGVKHAPIWETVLSNSHR